MPARSCSCRGDCAARTGTAPGWWALAEAAFRGIADAACVTGARPDLRCAGLQPTSFSAGLPQGWDVDTARNDSATATWHPSAQVPVFPGMASDASGLGAKDDRLVSAPVIATATSWLSLGHRFTLEAGRDGGLLEVQAGDAAWEPVPSQAFRMGGYQGRLADGTPAWTGSTATVDGLPSWQGYVDSVVDLSAYDGQTIRLRWRLLQDSARADSLPGTDWFLRFVTFAEVVADAFCPPVKDSSDERCSSLDPPAAVSTQVLTDTPERTTIDVRVALDLAEGADIALLARDDPEAAEVEMAALEARALDHLAAVDWPYDPLSIDVAFSFDLLAPLDADGSPRDRSQEWDGSVVGEQLDDREPYHVALFRIAREQYDDRPPKGADLVYVLTDVDLKGVGGVAACVGGIAYPSYSFALGLLLDGNAEDTSTIAAHEIGHLFGAHHHFANCAESLPARAANTWLDKCTLMSPDVGLAWLQFSSVNAAIVCGYADAYLPD